MYSTIQHESLTLWLKTPVERAEKKRAAAFVHGSKDGHSILPVGVINIHMQVISKRFRSATMDRLDQGGGRRSRP